MKAKFLIIISIALCMAMPISIQAQEKKSDASSSNGTIVFPPAKNEKILTKVSAFTGTIVKWHSNVDYIYNAFDLKVGDEVYYVGFPTTLGSKIRSIGDNVTVNGTIKKEANKIHLVSIKGKGEMIYAKNTDDATPIVLPDEFKSGKGKMTGQMINEWGKPIGIMVDDNIFLKMPLQAAEQLGIMLEYNAIVEYTGMVKNLKKGEVADKSNIVIHCHTITINGTQYLVR